MESNDQPINEHDEKVVDAILANERPLEQELLNVPVPVPEQDEHNNVPVTIDPMKELLPDLIVFITKYIGTKSLKVKLNEAQLRVLNKVLTKYPQFFGELREPLLQILDDGKIDFTDIPEMIIIINKAAKMNLKKLKLKSSDILTLIGTIMFMLVDSDVIHTGDNKQLYLNLINVTIRTLESNVVGFNKCACF